VIEYNYKLPKKLTLDMSIWRCGKHSAYYGSSRDNDNTGTGQGNTKLLNDEGYMCCLGQFAHQAGVLKEELLDHSYPHELPKEFYVEGLVFDFNVEDSFFPSSTDFAKEAITINDETETTVAEKIELLKKSCETYGRELVIENLIESEDNGP